MRSVQGSSRLGNLKARSPKATTKLLRTDGSTDLQPCDHSHAILVVMSPVVGEWEASKHTSIKRQSSDLRRLYHGDEKPQPQWSFLVEQRLRCRQKCNKIVIDNCCVAMQTSAPTHKMKLIRCNSRVNAGSYG